MLVPVWVDVDESVDLCERVGVGDGMGLCKRVSGCG